MAGPDPRVGTTLAGRYRIVAQIASGGMGTVYRGERIGLERPVAIKFLHSFLAAHDEIRQRFAVEARAMSRLAHPACVSVIDFGMDEGAPFLVMDYVTGKTLRSVIDEGPLAVDKVLALMRLVLAGLEHAHAQGIVHRDIKPENIVLPDVTGLGMQPRILDFGLAKLLDSSSHGLTAGFAIGTPSYMAPEQASGGAIDARTDVYAMGVLLFECLTGSKPFRGEQIADVLRQHRETAPPRLRAAKPGFSAALEAVILRAMAKAPAERFPSAREMAAALDATPEARGTARAQPAKKGSWGWPVAVLAAGALATAGVVVWRAQQQEQGVVTTPVAEGPEEAPPPPEVPVTPTPAPRAPDDPPALEEAERLIAAGRWKGAVDLLTSLRKKHPGNARVAYLLGNLYLEKLWGQEGFDAYKAAVKNDPAYRKDPVLIRASVRMLVSDTHGWRASRFLRDEIGKDAIPYLEEVQNSKVTRIRQSARRLLAELR